ncbi:winged helix-turn-helix domain-containing protein [Patescibacteria group bacterium]|nr:winged helix-turn-helix domain-containing protein [Patescibacteria group bacterium]
MLQHSNIVPDRKTKPLVKDIWCSEIDVYIKGTPVALTVREMMIFSLLLSKPDTIFSRETLLEAQKHGPYKRGRQRLRSIDAYVSRIKKKIKDATGYTNIIMAEYGMGYYLNRRWHKE